MISEVIGLSQHGIADFSCRTSIGVFEQALDPLRSELGSSLPALDNSLGHHKQLISPLKRQHGRFISHVSEESKRHSATLQSMHALRIPKHGQHTPCVAIGQDAKSQVETTQKGWGKAHALCRLDQGAIDVMR